MNTNIEKEYKLLVNEQQFKTLLSYYPEVQFKKQINTYYDTFDHTIQSRKGAMRIREVHNSYLFTLKLLKDDDVFEYECVVKENSPCVFEQEDIKQLLDENDIQGPFYPLISLTTNRAMVCSEFAELCFDENFYNHHKDYEIEYEYKKDHDGLSAFNTILHKASLHYEKNCSSKIKRAMDSLK